jgi:DNA-directed RNA polymerase specialized sigma24 family protein
MLELLAKNHKTWVNMVLGMGASPDIAKDIVQSMYLRIDKYVKDEKKIMYKNDEVNGFFIYVTLKNMYISYKKSKHLNFEVQDEEPSKDVEGSLDSNVEMERAFIRLVKKIDDEIKTWHRYDRILSDKYLKSDYSLRDISEGTGISLTSIFHRMRQNKSILREKFSEDWDDFKNGDYNLI